MNRRGHRGIFEDDILGEYRGHEPLDDYGSENGCSMIEFEQDGEWVSLEEFQSRVLAGNKR